MRIQLSALVAFMVLAIAAGAVEAREAATNTELALRAGPGAQYELFLSMPAGAVVSVGGCTRGWCKLRWNSYSGYASQSGLVVRQVAAGAAPSVAVTPVYPVYPYRSGHYPTADSYYRLPPYADLSPRFYRWRHLMMAQERNRYRYEPHIFRGYSNY